MTKFKIDRSKWRCGQSGEFALGKGHCTLLLNEEGFMCCLGHIELQLGLTKDQINKRPCPDDTQILNILTKKRPKASPLEYNIYDNSELSERAIALNDKNDITTEIREKQLIDLFKRYGHELEFYGEPVNFKEDEI